MKEKIKKIKNNKALRIIGEIIYVLLFLLVILMLIVVVLQRVSDNSVTLGGFRLFSVATGSMVPEYEVGDVLIAKEIEPSEIKVGDDIVYRGKEGSFNGKIVTHRVISITEQDGVYHIITKGLANQEQDPEITDEQVYGKIVYQVKSLSAISKLTSNVYIFYFCIFVPIAIIIVRQIRQIALSKDEEDDEEDTKEDTKNIVETKKLDKENEEVKEKNKTKTKIEK